MGVITCDKPWCRCSVASSVCGQATGWSCSRENGPSGTASTRDTSSYNHITTPNRVAFHRRVDLPIFLSKSPCSVESLSGYRTKLLPSDFLGSIPTFQTLLSTIYGELFLVNLPIVFSVTPKWRLLVVTCQLLDKTSSGTVIDLPASIVEPVIIGWSDNSRDSWITGKIDNLNIQTVIL